jgi:hypothetical protein
MKAIMKNAVDRVYELLCLRTEDPKEYEFRIGFGAMYAAAWDEPANFRPASGKHKTIKPRRTSGKGRSATESPSG